MSFIEREFLPGILRYHNSRLPEVPECEGEVGELRPKEFADAIDRHWKTIDQHESN